ncbi:MAG: hypothetical protein HZB59_08700 [Ignavibacteriales bacterium]|nr:hypothetical protein [Ignavibacteriales bacterium]
MKNKNLFLKMLTICICIFLFSLNQNVRAQSDCPISEFSVSYADIQQLTISDVDFEHFESRTLLFTLRIKNESTFPVTAKLTLTVNIKLASGKRYEPAYIFSHDNLIINPGTLMLTNMDLNRAEYRLNSEETPNKDDVRVNIQDVAMATGKFPAGKYSFNFTLTNTRCGVVSSKPPVGELNLENPTRVDLRTPLDGETTSPFPLFEFYHDGVKAELTVAELRSEQSREDAIIQEPPMNKVEIAGTNSFLYGGGRPLESGKTYVWRVVSKTAGPAGSEIEVSSPIGLFYVSNEVQVGGAGDQNSQDKSIDDVLRMLEEMFGKQYPELIASLKKSKFTFDNGLLDGTSLSKDDLLKLLRQLQSDAVDMNLNVE